MKRVLLAAHRGYMAKYPENTILSYKKALELDIDQIEMDVRMTKDEKIICIHDALVDRTTDGTGYVKDKTLDEIKKLDAGIKRGEQFKGTRIPTFEEFLIFLQDYKWCEVNVELKDYPEDQGDRAYKSCDKVLNLLIKYDMLDRIYINCFSGQLLMYINKKYPNMFRLHGYYPLFLNKMGNHPQEERINYYDMIYCVGIFNVNRDNLTDDWVWSNDPIRPKEDFDRLHNKGIQCWVHFSEDSLYRFQRGYEVGVDAFTCNDPEMAAKMLDYIGARKYNTGKKANKI